MICELCAPDFSTKLFYGPQCSINLYVPPFPPAGSNILLWRRGSAVVSAANLMITRDPRFRLMDGYSLQIKGVRPQDAGDYICQIGDQENRDLVHTVEILVPPSVRAHPESGHVTARKGSSVTLECKASGNPVPSISWVKRVSSLGSFAEMSKVFKSVSSAGNAARVAASVGGADIDARARGASEQRHLPVHCKQRRPRPRLH